MSDRDDGGAAFPHAMSDAGHNDPPRMFCGMSLRDYFAASVLSGMMTNRGYKWTFEAMAKDAYLIADQMLEERKT